MIEPFLRDVEAQALVLLSGLHPNLTRRTAQFLPEGNGSSSLDVFARPQKQSGGPGGEDVLIAVQITAASRQASASFAADTARFLVDRARTILLTSRVPPFDSHMDTTYQEQADIEHGDPAYVCAAVMTCKYVARASNAKTIGIVRANTGDLHPDVDGKSLTSIATRAIVIDQAGGFTGDPIRAFYCNAEAGDTIELLDADDVVVDSTAALVGAGLASFVVSTEGAYRVAINDGAAQLVSDFSATYVTQPTS